VTTQTETSFAIEGELTIRTAAQVHEQLQDALEDGHYVLDLSRIEAMDSAGFQLLVAAHQTLLKTGLELQIVSASAPVKDLLSLYGYAGRFASTQASPS
jgi:anti-anti-sigma factor